MVLDATVKQRIEDLLKAHKLVLFMKGTPDFPQCGFSGTVVAILRDCGAEFHAVNVLEDQEIRQGIKEYAQWPTIPQLYVGGEFIGGCDIMTEMHRSGQLQKVIAEQGES